MLQPEEINEMVKRVLVGKDVSAQVPAQTKDEPGEASPLTALLIAQGLDLMSTEKPFGFLKNGPREMVGQKGDTWQLNGNQEGNPLPGMQAEGFKGTIGRIGWGAAESLLARELLKRVPKLGKILAGAATGVHAGMADNNWNNYIPYREDKAKKIIHRNHLMPKDKP